MYWCSSKHRDKVSIYWHTSCQAKGMLLYDIWPVVKVHLYEGFLFYGYTCPEVLFSCRCLVFGKNWSNYRSIVYIFIGTGILSHEGCSSVFACQVLLCVGVELYKARPRYRCIIVSGMNVSVGCWLVQYVYVRTEELIWKSVIDKDYELYKSRGVILLQVCDSYKQVAYI